MPRLGATMSVHKWPQQYKSLIERIGRSLELVTARDRKQVALQQHDTYKKHINYPSQINKQSDAMYGFFTKRPLLFLSYE
jgi:hypothetical protein